MAAPLFPGLDQYTTVTINGLYDNNTGSPLFAANGTTAPTSGVLVGGIDSNGNFQPLSQTPNGYLNVNGDFVGTLTNNNAAPVATNVGALTGLAATSYTTNTYTNGFQVLPVTDLHGALNQDLQAVAGVQLGATAVVAFGSAPAAVNVPAVNSSIFSGTTSITNTAGSLNVNVTNTTVPVAGTLTNNNAAPAANNIGALAFIAETAYTTATYTTGDQVLAVTDLHGAINNDLQAVGGVAVVSAAAGVQKVGISGATGATLDSTVVSGTAPTNALAVSGVYNVTEPAPTNTQATALQQDQAANLLEFPGVQFKTGAAWNSGTGAGTFQYPTGTTTQGQDSGAPAYVVQLDSTSTITGGVVTFQGTYDNVNWTTIPVSQVLNPNTFAQLTNPYTLTPTANVPFLILAQGYVGVRADLSTAITGTGTVTPYWSSLAYEPAIASSTSSTVSGTLSNNTAAPIADNVGVLPAIAETAYNTVTYTTGNQVLPVTDLHGALNQDLQAVAGVQLGATAVTAFGSAPAAVNVPAVNSSIFSGTTALTNTGGALNVEITGSTATLTVAGNLTNNNAAPIANNIGALIAVTNSGTFPAVTLPAYTAGDQELLRVSQGGSLVIIPADEEYQSSVLYYSIDSTSNGASPALVSLANATIVPLISIQSNSTTQLFTIREVQGYGDGSQIKFFLIKNPQTLTGSAFTATGIPTGSHIKLDVTATAVTIGTGSVVWTQMAASVDAYVDNLLQYLAAGTPGDTYTLAAAKFGTGTSKAYGMIRWSEEAASI